MKEIENGVYLDEQEVIALRSRTSPLLRYLRISTPSGGKQGDQWTLVLQKSSNEGLGLSVSEGMWKGKPIIWPIMWR